MIDKYSVIRITKETKDRITELSKKTGLKEITVLEYLIKGKLKLNNIKKSYEVLQRI